jgi:pantoate--beta-alanine ligase
MGKVLREALAGARGLQVDYVEIVDPETLLSVGDLCRGALVAVAAWVGSTRLIDNVLIPPMCDGAKP